VIFVTVGTQLPFDRLVETVDTWALENGVTDIFAQTGKSKYKPRAIRSSAYLTPPEYNAKFAEASLIIGHAGMGTILKAMESNTPILVLPRLSVLKEHRSDHQVDTAQHLQKLQLVTVAWDAKELKQRLQANAQQVDYQGNISPFASDGLINGLRDFVRDSVADTKPTRAKRRAATTTRPATPRKAPLPASLLRAGWLRRASASPGNLGGPRPESI
jgi:UDP-N-acetylglucosamine transferase subunit ALG13